MQQGCFGKALRFQNAENPPKIMWLAVIAAKLLKFISGRKKFG